MKNEAVNEMRKGKKNFILWTVAIMFFNLNVCNSPSDNVQDNNNHSDMKRDETANNERLESDKHTRPRYKSLLVSNGYQ